VTSGSSRPWFPREIRRAAQVITVSNDAREQITERYHVPENKISTMYNGPGAGADSVTAKDASRELAAMGLNMQRPFVLAVGNVQPRKNLARLLNAFAEVVLGRGHDIDLFIVGARRFRADARGLRKGAHLKTQDRPEGRAPQVTVRCYMRRALNDPPRLFELRESIHLWQHGVVHGANVGACAGPLDCVFARAPSACSFAK
jgi:hypothetical protein